MTLGLVKGMINKNKISEIRKTFYRDRISRSETEMLVTISVVLLIPE